MSLCSLAGGSTISKQYNACVQGNMLLLDTGPRIYKNAWLHNADGHSRYLKSSSCDAVMNAVSYQPLSWYCLPDRFLLGVTTLLKIAWRHDPDCRATSWCNSCVGDVFEVLPTFMNLSTFCFNVIFTQ